MNKNYLVKDKIAVSEIICVTGAERDPSNAFEAATALAEVIKTATECDIEIKSPDARKDGVTEIFIAVTGDGADSSMTLSGDAFSIHTMSRCSVIQLTVIMKIPFRVLTAVIIMNL